MPCGSRINVPELRKLVKMKQPNLAVSRMTRPLLLEYYEGKVKDSPVIPKPLPTKKIIELEKKKQKILDYEIKLQQERNDRIMKKARGDMIEKKLLNVVKDIKKKRKKKPVARPYRKPSKLDNID